MNIGVEHSQARIQVAVLRLSGHLDGSNYREVIDKARAEYQAGARGLLLDLSQTPYMSSAGLVALHTAALVFAGRELPDSEFGWRAVRAAGEARESGRQTQVKLLSPQPAIVGVLKQTGLADHFETFTDQAEALASF
jgi:anti-anti-sigma regulatory factor